MPRKEFLPFFTPSIGDVDIEEMIDTMKSSWITTGPKTRLFEEKFREYLDAEGALALNSCTAGLHAALKILNIGPGDEVITTPMTFAASVNVIEHVGATPVLVDIEADTMNIDPELIPANITSHTKAILPVHFAGHPANMTRITEIADSHSLSVIEDAAHAFPAKYKNKYIGSGKNLAAFSFYGSKNITTAEGGMLTGDPELLEKARELCLHGLSKNALKRYEKTGDWYYEILTPGFKYNMSDLQAGIGLSQLRQLKDFQNRRREIFDAYNAAFSNLDSLEIPTIKQDIEHSLHLYVIRLNVKYLTLDRDTFILELRKRNIGSSVHFIPIHLHPYYKEKYGFSANDLPVAYNNYVRSISLPCYPKMTDEDINDVIESVLEII